MPFQQPPEFGPQAPERARMRALGAQRSFGGHLVAIAIVAQSSAVFGKSKAAALLGHGDLTCGSCLASGWALLIVVAKLLAAHAPRPKGRWRSDMVALRRRWYVDCVAVFAGN